MPSWRTRAADLGRGCPIDALVWQCFQGKTWVIVAATRAYPLLFRGLLCDLRRLAVVQAVARAQFPEGRAKRSVLFLATF